MAILNDSVVNGMLTVNGTLNLQSTDGNEIWNVASEIEKLPRKLSVEQYVSDTIDSVLSWTYILSHTGSEAISKTLPKPYTEYHELMITLSVWYSNGNVSEASRVLNSIIIPTTSDAFNHWYDPSNGQHQCHFDNNLYQCGISFVSATQVKVYANGTSLLRLYGR